VKTKTLRLSFPHAPANSTTMLYDTSKTPDERQQAFDAARRYRVEQVTDSIRYEPGQYLETAAVSILCDDDGWKVTIVPVKN